MSYHTSNLLYRPSVSVWTARRKDKSESLKVNANAGAISGAANVHKQLLPDNEALEAIQKHVNVFRTWVYDSTLPWDDAGWRIGQVSRHMDFMSEAGDYMRKFDALVLAFLNGYDQAVSEAAFKLNALYDYSDYPTKDEVASKFRINLECMPLPNVDDFRVVEGVDTAEVERLCSQAADAVEQKIKAGMDEAYARLFGVVSKMATTLRQYSNKEVKKFNDTLVSNIGDLVQIMPALNITGDARLTALAQEAENLAQYAAADLRSDESTRRAAMLEAEVLMRKFEGDETTPAPAQNVGHIDLAMLLRDMV